MFPKIIETDPYLVAKNGTFEPTISILEPNTMPGVKLASEAMRYSSTIKPVPGKTIILVLAMGASEYYGPNRNGDAFEEEELKKKHHTFKTNANVFRSHVNKDPAKSIGKVLESFYNDDMHRVELILELDNDLASNEVEKIRSQKDLAVSMGCRIKYDVCSICSNKAPTRNEYCKHLKYEMGEIYDDGRVVCAYNPDPNFFDISVVFRPADKTGYMLKKIARFGTSTFSGVSSADLAIKTSGMTVLSQFLSKAADIDKTISGIAVEPEHSNVDNRLDDYDRQLSIKWLRSVSPAILDTYGDIDSGVLENLSRKSFSESIRHLSRSGVFLMTGEFMDLLFNKVLGKPAPEGLTDKLVGLQKDIFELLSRHPEVPTALVESKALPVGSEEFEVSDLDESSRDKISSSLKNSFSKTSSYISEDEIKLAGYGAALYSVYLTGLLEKTSCKKDNHGLKSIMGHYSEKTSSQDISLLSYLKHRTCDLAKNMKTNTRSSVKYSSHNIHLFKTQPENFFYLLGRDILNS